LDFATSVPVEVTVGTDAQVLMADSTQPSGMAWTPPPEGVVWGNIIGTLTNQSDLNTALQNKSNINHTHIPSQVGLAKVTNDAQLKRGADDINSFPLKSSPVGGDILLGEDSANGYAKIKIPISGVASGASVIDGGNSSSIYGGVTAIDGGNA
jgi:hypothetical protein